MFWVWPAAEISCPFLSTRKTTLALASLVRRSQTALIRLYSSSYITSCWPMGVRCPLRCRGIDPGFSRDSAWVRAADPSTGRRATVAGSIAVRQGSAPGGATERLRARPGSGRVATSIDPTRRDPDLAPGPGRACRRGRWHAAGARVDPAGQARPGPPPVMISGVPPVPADFDAWLAPYTEWRSAMLADPGDDGKSMPDPDPLRERPADPPGGRARWGCASSLPSGRSRWPSAAWLPGDAADRLLPPGHRRGRELPAVPARSQDRPAPAGHRRQEPARGVHPLSGRPAPGVLRHRPQWHRHRRLPRRDGQPDARRGG